MVGVSGFVVCEAGYCVAHVRDKEELKGRYVLFSCDYGCEVCDRKLRRIVISSSTESTSPLKHVEVMFPLAAYNTQFANL